MPNCNHPSGVIPWWTTNGNLDPAEASRQLAGLRERGITEFFLYPNFGLENADFLSEAWFEWVAWVIAECKRTGMHLWIYDELNWPSGSAGGRLCRERPEYLMRTLRSRSVTLEPGEEWRPEPDAEYGCVEVVPGRFLNAAERQSGFRNDAAAAVRLFIVQKVRIDDPFFCCMGTTGTRNERGIMDALNPDAVRCWMNYTYQSYADRFPDELGTTIRGFFFDEPTMVSPFHTGDVPWTPGLEELFARTYGYAMTPHLRSLFEPVPGEEQFRLDFWTLVSNRFAESFAKQLADWCKAHHLYFSGHCWPEEPSCQRLMTTATGHVHLLQQHLSLPGTDFLYVENCFTEKAGMCPAVPKWARNLIYSAKLPASTARYNGAGDSICESSGIAHRGTPPAVQKKALDFLFAMGVSILNPSRPCDLTDFRKYVCAADAGEPYWKHYRKLVEYSLPLTAFNRRGRVAARVAVLDPLTTKFACTEITPDTSIRKEFQPLARGADCAEPMLATLEALVRRQQDFELIFEEVIREGAVSAAGELLVPESAFLVLILPHCTVLDSRVWEKLHEFSRKGGTLIAVGDAPSSRMQPGGSGPVAATLPVIRLDPAAPDFAGRLQTAIEAAVPAPYQLTGEGADGVLALLREETENSWAGLLLVNAVPGRKTLRLQGPLADRLQSLADLQSGERRPWTGEVVELEEEAAVLLTTEPPPAGRVEKRGGRVEAIPEDGWRPVTPLRNAMRLSLAVRQDGRFQPLADTGASTLRLDPDVTPEITLRGTFRIADAVPEDLRLWLDYPDFRDLTVNGVPVTVRRREKVIDPRNVTVPVAPQCRVGENMLQITVTLSPWLTARRGIRVHLGHLLEGCEPLVVLGNFQVRSPGTLAPVAGTLHCGELDAQGFPQFGDELTVVREFVWERAETPYFLELGESLLPVAAALNGTELGVRLWRNGGLAIPEGTVKRGGNTLTLRLSGEIWDLLGMRWAELPLAAPPLRLPAVKLHF